MSFDFNAAEVDSALLEQFDFGNRDRFSYPAVVTSSAPTQNIGSDVMGSLPQSQQLVQSPQSLSPTTPWIILDMAQQQQQQRPPQQQLSPVTASSPDDQSVQSPGFHSDASSPSQQPTSFRTPTHINTNLLSAWTMQQHGQAQQQPAGAGLTHFIQEPLMGFNPFATGFPQTSMAYMTGQGPTSLAASIPSTTHPATTQASLQTSLQMDLKLNAISPVEDTTHTLPWSMGMASWQDLGALNFAPNSMPRVGDDMSHSLGNNSIESNSPTGTYLEVLSLNSTSDNDWAVVGNGYTHYNHAQFSQPQQAHGAAVFNPGETLHLRTSSECSQSDSKSLDMGSFDEVTLPRSPFSPESDSCLDQASNHRDCFGDEHHGHQHHQSPDVISPAAAVGPITIKAVPPVSQGPAPPANASGSGSVLLPPRRNSGTRKSPTAKATKSVIRRGSNEKKEGNVEKKVGRRRGPLLPEQRKQASEIRKLRACLRCKFLKKTCDKGEPCNGCQPSHARLWQVPCTRIDIKDIGYFMKDWKADYERHLSRGMSVFNVKGFAPKETLMWITHGYGFCLPISVREVYVADESCLQAVWVESHYQDQDPVEFEIRTERLDVGQDGVTREALNQYLDMHVDGTFTTFVDDHFEGTPFITELFKTVHRYYLNTKVSVIRKALKLILAYNLTMRITMVEQPPYDIEGQIDDNESKFYGRHIAPVMINFQIKCRMADMWRELQKEILEELSVLYSSVYSGDRLKNWPTIFMLASILLAMWEEMQFDCHYRTLDPVAIDKFCTDMESIPVGVIIGLFHAISQKLPALGEWDTNKHGQLLLNDAAVCNVMTDVRQIIMKHGNYLRGRPDAKFDRYDFDSLSNKFVSKLVIRVN